MIHESDRRHGMIEKEKSLAYLYPEVAMEWHPTKNGEMTPYDITPGSTKKIWWLGVCGHEWEVSPNGRIRVGRTIRGCPYCSGNKVLVGYNDLSTTNPQLAKEWHPTKNNGLLPQDVTAGSERKVWWTDSLNHEWEAAIKDRNKGNGCPYCARKMLLRGFNDLATTHPNLAKEWHPTKNASLRPCDIISGTHKKVWWMCAEKHEWQATCNSRADSDTGCPKCSKINGAKKKNASQIKKHGSIVDTNPELATEWHPIKNGKKKPENYLAGSEQKVWWLGRCGHEWEAMIRDRNHGIGCPICSNHQLLKGYNDLQTCNPSLAEEWHPTLNGTLSPDSVVFGTEKKVWWKCRICGNSWEATVVARRNGSGCPRCSSERSTSYPEQAVYFYLRKLFPNAINRYVLENHELDIYLPDIHLGIEYDGDYYHTEETKNREERKDRYFFDNGIDVLHIKEDIRSTGEPSNILTYQPSSNYGTLDEVIRRLLLFIQTKYGIVADFTIDNRNEMSEIMSGYLSTVKTNSIEALAPKLLEEWDYQKNGDLNPAYLSANSNKKVWWKCTLGHEWQAIVYTRIKGSRCPYCTNKKAWPGFNDLNTVNPTLSKEWNYNKNGELLPSMVTKSSMKKVWWKCPLCDFEWQATINNRDKGSGCPSCYRRSRIKK